jgi:hypothetical protein
MEVRLIQQIDIVENYTGPEDIHSGFWTGSKRKRGAVSPVTTLADRHLKPSSSQARLR